MEYPKYLVRPDDYVVFVSQTENPGLYAVKSSLEQWPDHLHNWYKYQRLIDGGWFPCEESELDEMKKKHDAHMDFVVWQCRSDGHGGRKGGTMEEYLEYKERVEAYNKNKKNAEQ